MQPIAAAVTDMAVATTAAAVSNGKNVHGLNVWCSLPKLLHCGDKPLRARVEKVFRLGFAVGKAEGLGLFVLARGEAR